MKLFVIREGDGEYDDYHETTVAILRGKKSADLEKLATEYGEAMANTYAKVRTRGMPKHWKFDIRVWIKWLVLRRGFTLVKDYEEFCW